MSKTFKEYYDDDGMKIRKNKKKFHKDTRRNVKNYLKNMDMDLIDEDEEYEDFEV